MKTTNITIINKLGLHARAAAKLVTTASAYASDVKIGRPEKLIDGKSIMAVMMLAAGKGTDLQIRVEGSDQDLALDAIVTLINNRFDEGE
jgi:phosphocarrier protein